MIRGQAGSFIPRQGRDKRLELDGKCWSYGLFLPSQSAFSMLACTILYRNGSSKRGRFSDDFGIHLKSFPVAPFAVRLFHRGDIKMPTDGG